MRTSIHSLSLLLFALPALSIPYHICSPARDCIVSTGQEQPGHPVRTAHRHHDSHRYPPNTLVDVHAHVAGHHSTTGHVSGLSKSGLFIGRSRDGRHLIWVEEPFAHKWEFTPGAQRGFHVVQVPGHEEFWLDAGSDKPVEVVGPDHGDVYWTFDPILF
ncbi:hypothetical protein APHAL10511_006912 [Amanita phalloides]|nr:hypothetical protein APHAL10511_006912 [Amanita phalloides]